MNFGGKKVARSAELLIKHALVESYLKGIRQTAEGHAESAVHICRKTGRESQSTRQREEDDALV